MGGEGSYQKTKARLEKGFWTFRAPIGYQYVRSKFGGKELVRDEPLAGIIQEALEGFASGRFGSPAEVKRFLENDPHFPNDTAKGEIRAQTVARIMEQVVYAGYLKAPSFDVSLRKARHEGIISLETFEKIAEKRQENAYLPARKDIHKDFVLRGAVHCDGCQKSLRAAWSQGKKKKYAYYVCQSKGCAFYGKSIPRDVIEGAFESLLKSMQPSKTVFNIVKTMFKDAWETQAAKTILDAKAFQRDAKQAEKEIDELVKRVMESSSPRVVQAYENRIDELEKKKLIL